MAFAIELEGARALVTGAGQGVGREIARTLARAGAVVVVNDLRGELAEDTAEEIGAAGGSAEPAPFDVTDFAAVEEAVGRAEPLDILVNNAGSAGAAGWTFGPFAESAPEEWRRYVDVNLYGVMHCTRAVLPAMVARRYGRIVTIVSDAARWGDPQMAPYAAAKAGAAGFTRSIAREAGRFGVTVNNVALGTIDTESTPQGEGSERSEHDRQRFRQYIIRRPGRPSDVAPMVAFLASRHAEWITGQTIPVNGGYTVAL